MRLLVVNELDLDQVASLKDSFNNGGIKVGFPWTLGGVSMEAVLRFAWHDASILTMSHQCSENISVRDNESLFAFLDRLTEDQNRPVRLSVVDLRPRAVCKEGI